MQKLQTNFSQKCIKFTEFWHGRFKTITVKMNKLYNHLQIFHKSYDF